MALTRPLCRRGEPRSGSLVAGVGARVRERSPARVLELPVVAAVAERHPQHTVGRVGARLAVRGRVLEWVEPDAASADDERSDALRWISNSLRRLGREPFVVVVVPLEDDIDPGVVERLDYGLDVGERRVFCV